MLTLFKPKPFVIISTAQTGAITTVLAADYLIENVKVFKNLIWPTILTGQRNDNVCQYTLYIWLVSIVLFLVSVLFQFCISAKNFNHKYGWYNNEVLNTGRVSLGNIYHTLTLSPKKEGQSQGSKSQKQPENHEKINKKLKKSSHKKSQKEQAVLQKVTVQPLLDQEETSRSDLVLAQNLGPVQPSPAGLNLNAQVRPVVSSSVKLKNSVPSSHFENLKFRSSQSQKSYFSNNSSPSKKFFNEAKNSQPGNNTHSSLNSVSIHSSAPILNPKIYKIPSQSTKSASPTTSVVSEDAISDEVGLNILNHFKKLEREKEQENSNHQGDLTFERGVMNVYR